MKKDNIRNIALLILITVSLFSYSYLSCVSQNAVVETSNFQKEEPKEVNQIYVPDIALVKKMLQLGSTVFDSGL